MKKIIINISSYYGSIGAEHYYAKVLEFETDDADIYDIAREYLAYNPDAEYQLMREIDVTEAIYLNKKDGTTVWHNGSTTERFHTYAQIKEIADNEFPENDLAFLYKGELRSEDNDIVVRNPQIPKKTGQKIKIHNFEGFSKEFINLVENSVHEVIETPERYKGNKLQDGYWVWGVTEPVLVLKRECKLIEEDEK